MLMEAVFQNVCVVEVGENRGRGETKKGEEKGKEMGRKGVQRKEQVLWETESQIILRSWSQTIARLSKLPVLGFLEMLLIHVKKLTLIHIS